MNKRIDAILRHCQERGLFPGITRYTYDINADEELQVISAIGKSRTPDFVIDGHNKAAYLNMLKWCIGDKTAMAQNPDTKEFIPANMKAGWWIAGNTGSGKSWCLDILAAYCQFMKFKIAFGDDEAALVWRNRRADDICAAYQETGAIQFRDARILGIHDVGTEQKESVYMGNRASVIANILEYRGDRPDTITMATSNISIGGKKIAEIYGVRAESRIREMFNYIEIKGVDRRKK